MHTAPGARASEASGRTVLVPDAQDPLADGPVIQAASTRALEAGTTLDRVLAMLKGVSPRLRAPVVMFTYYNPIMARGPENFCAQARDAGASGERRQRSHHTVCRIAGSATCRSLCWRGSAALVLMARTAHLALP